MGVLLNGGHLRTGLVGQGRRLPFKLRILCSERLPAIGAFLFPYGPEVAGESKQTWRQQEQTGIGDNGFRQCLAYADLKSAGHNCCTSAVQLARGIPQTPQNALL